MRVFTTVQEKILDRALYLAGQHSSFQIPVREITKAAGVNVNAVNYYFGNKEEMLRQMETFFIQNYLAVYAVLDDQALSPEEKLTAWANEIMEYTLQYPGIQGILKQIIRSEHTSAMKTFLLENGPLSHEKVNRLFAQVMGLTEENVEPYRTIFDSAVLHPVSFGTDIHFNTQKVKDRDFRLSYIKTLIAVLKKGILL